MSLRKISALVLALAMPLVLALPVAVLSADKPAAKSKPVSYTVDTSVSTVQWLAKKVTGQHNGTVPVKSGNVVIDNGALVGGTIVIDTANLNDTSLNGEYHDKLNGHLKSEDFFSVVKYPTSKFEITLVKKLDAPNAKGETHEVTGNLTIKDKTNPITFGAKIAMNDKVFTATANGVAIDRTLFDIRYGSGKFFQGLGDKVINDQFWLDFDITAKK